MHILEDDNKFVIVKMTRKEYKEVDKILRIKSF
jgi:hypothetical protein